MSKAKIAERCCVMSTSSVDNHSLLKVRTRDEQCPHEWTLTLMTPRHGRKNVCDYHAKAWTDYQPEVFIITPEEEVSAAIASIRQVT